jgi:hypothetical protein
MEESLMAAALIFTMAFSMPRRSSAAFLGFPDYDSGRDGPKAADELLARDGERAWRPVIPASDCRRPRRS